MRHTKETPCAGMQRGQKRYDLISTAYCSSLFAGSQQVFSHAFDVARRALKGHVRRAGRADATTRRLFADVRRTYAEARAVEEVAQ